MRRSRHFAGVAGDNLKGAIMFERLEQKVEEHSESILLWWDRISKVLAILAVIGVTILFAAQIM